MGTIPNAECVQPTELCWQTGNFTDNCECEFCEHKETKKKKKKKKKKTKKKPNTKSIKKN